MKKLLHVHSEKGEFTANGDVNDYGDVIRKNEIWDYLFWATSESSVKDGIVVYLSQEEFARLRSIL